MLELINYSKSYGKNLVIKSDQLIIPEGLTIIRGANGSGKTTLIRCIAGVIPYKGVIRLWGTDQVKFPVKYRRLVSYAEASPSYPPFLTGRDLIKYYCQVRKVPDSESNELQHLFHISDFVNEKIETYSEGMHKKLTLCLAFTGSCRLIILDEPYAFLDEGSRGNLMELISAYRKKKKTNFLVSSHASGAAEDFNPSAEYLVDNHGLSKIS
jgi:ABC-2 type transport system ATP-binding protein